MYKRGDKVMVMTEEEILEIYSNFRSVPYQVTVDMRHLCGQTLTVDTCVPDSYSNGGYLIKFTNDGYNWSWHSSVIKHDNNVTDKVFNVLRGQ